MLLAQCAVCQELFSGDISCVMSALPCGHVFHKVCVDTWFRSSPTCPHCRIQVKPTKAIARLFFDVLPLVSNSPHSEDSVAVGNPTDPNQGNHSNQQLRLELRRMRLEITRLEESLRQTERKAENSSKLLADREKEVLNITALYTEAEKLFEKERQRGRELRMELGSLKQFLREAEAMKATAAKLRVEMEGMENIKKLIASSEESAHELLARYTSTKDSTPRDLSCDLTSLCRWASVLRTELTSSREKVRNYRIELSRVRKLHQAASQRAARAEKLATQREDQVRQLENQLSELTKSTSLREEICMDTPGVHSNEADEATTQTPTSLSTPDLLVSTPKDPSTVELQKRLRTPLENPFRALTDDTKSHNLRISKVHSFECPLFATPLSRAVKNPDLQSANFQRRPSVLYEMAIMRRHVQASNASAFSMSRLLRSSAPASTLVSGEANCSRQPSSHSSKRSATNPKGSKPQLNKLLRLDTFFSKC